MVGIAVRRLVAGAGGAPFATEATLAPDEQTGSGTESGVAGVGVDRGRLDHDQCAGALVVDGGDPARRPHRALRRDGAVDLDGLLAVDEHGRVEFAQRGGRRQPAAPSAPAPLADDDGEGGQHPLVVSDRVLGRELELEAWVNGAGAHTQGVEQGVLRRPRPFGLRRCRSHGSHVDRHSAPPSREARSVT